MNKYSKEVEVRGHLIDSMILTKIFDNIMDLDGKFEVTKIKVGKLKTDESFAKIRVIGKNQNHLNEILETLYRVGATLKTQKSIKFAAPPSSSVAGGCQRGAWPAAIIAAGFLRARA